MLRVAARAAAGAAAISVVASEPSGCQRRGVSSATHAELQKLRPGEEAMRGKWEEDEAGWHLLPPRAWPARWPKPEEVPELRRQIKQRGCPDDFADATTSEACTRLSFDLATALFWGMAEGVEGQPEGFARYVAQAERGDPESMVAVGTVLIDNDESAARVREGVGWLRRAAQLGSAQADYELGTAAYTGLGEAVPEDEAAAFALFERAAAQRHTGGLFMLAECCIEGCGCERDHPRAVRLLEAAAAQGHRMARQYLREWLDEDAGRA